MHRRQAADGARTDLPDACERSFGAAPGLAGHPADGIKTDAARRERWHGSCWGDPARWYTTWNTSAASAMPPTRSAQPVDPANRREMP